MLRIECAENIRHHVYHIASLYYPFEEIVFHQEESDLSVHVEENRLCIVLFGAEYLYTYTEPDDIRRSLFTLLRDHTGKTLPWGILVGVRPSKIALRLLGEGMLPDAVEKTMMERYLLRRDKAELSITVAGTEKTLLGNIGTGNTASIYIGMPFCPTRCVYCSFASNPIKGNRYVDDYIAHLKMEIDMVRAHVDRKGIRLNTLYFGGGTPTAVNDEQFKDIMEHLHRNLVEGRDLLEFTVEAGRVDSLDEYKLRVMKEYGVDRISINPQTMNDDTLRIIGRNHDSRTLVDMFHTARRLGFDNINMDVIVGLPGEGLPEIRHTMEEIAKLRPESLTVHGLALKRASKLYDDFLENGRFRMRPQEELIAMYDLTRAYAKELGLHPYYMYRQKNTVGNMENIGYSAPGRENLYNIIMIEEVEDIIALGADAISKKVIGKKYERFANHKDVHEYLADFTDAMDKKLGFLEPREEF